MQRNRGVLRRKSVTPAPIADDERAARSHLSSAQMVQLARHAPTLLTRGHVLALQRSIGNRTLARLLSEQDEMDARPNLQPTVATRAPLIQPKVRVGPVGDHDEQEADRIAEEVTRPAPTSARPPSPQSMFDKNAPRKEDQTSSASREAIYTKPVATRPVQRTPTASRISTVQRNTSNLIQRNWWEKLKKQPVKDKDRQTDPFKLILSRNQRGHSGLLTPYTKAGKGVNYKDMENNPDRFGLGPKPGDMEPYTDYLTDYLIRAMHTASDTEQGGGGISFNLNGYGRTNIEVLVQKYLTLLAKKQETDPEASYLTHKEFMGSEFTALEGPAAGATPSYTSPGYTDWELATILSNPDLRKATQFHDVTSVHESGYDQDPTDLLDMGYDLQELEEMNMIVYVMNELNATDLEDRFGIK